MTNAAKKGLKVAYLLLVLAGLFHVSCLAPYYYDEHHVRIWRDGHDDAWHQAHGDHWDEERRDDQQQRPGN